MTPSINLTKLADQLDLLSRNRMQLSFSRSYEDSVQCNIDTNGSQSYTCGVAPTALGAFLSAVEQRADSIHCVRRSLPETKPDRATSKTSKTAEIASLLGLSISGQT